MKIGYFVYHATFLGDFRRKALVLLHDAEGADHVMLALLALQHRYLQIFQMAPACLQIASIMPITGKLIGIATATAGTLPVNRTLGAAHLTRLSLRSSSFGRHLGFQKSHQDRPDRVQGRGFGLLLHTLDETFTLACLELTLGKVYTHDAVDSL
jgi:hypothetical protein